MEFTRTDLDSAAEKLASLDFTEAELEAMSAVLSGRYEPDGDDEVSGFSFDPIGGSGHQMMANMSRRVGRRRATPAGPTGIIVIETGHCY